MKKFLKVLGYIFLAIISFIIIVFAIVGFSTSGVNERADDVILKIQSGEIETLYNEIHNLEIEQNIVKQLSLEQFKNAIILPNGLADLRTIKNISWNGKGFENSIKYIEGDGELANGIKIHLRLEFLEKDDKYIFYGIVWNQIK